MQNTSERCFLRTDGPTISSPVSLSPRVLCSSGSSQISSPDVRRMSQTGSLSAALIRPMSAGTTANANRSRRLCHTQCFHNTERERAQASCLGQTVRVSRSLWELSSVENALHRTQGRRQINLGTQGVLQLETCNLLPREGPYSIS